MAPVNTTMYEYHVSQEFFSLYGIPIVRGRGFDAADASTAVIVSQRVAQLLWPNVDPLDRSFRFEKEVFRVVGVARETHFPAIDRRLDGPEFYRSYTPIPAPMLSLRCEADCPDGAVIRHRLASTHPEITVYEAQPVDLEYAAQLARPRAAAALAVTFAAIALAGAAGGLFSVLSYAVRRRRREFGVRAALGASPRQTRRIVLRDAVGVAVAGIVIGSVFAAVFARALTSLQYGVTPSDPASWVAVIALIGMTVVLASWAPARAAATVDPLVLLREE
jgi:hypothetical protein